MEGESFGTDVLGLVFLVSGDGMAFLRKMDANLVLAASEKMNINQAEPF